MDFAEILSFNREDPEDFAEQRVWVCSQMLLVRRKHLYDLTKLGWANSLDDVALVVAKEEEAAWAASSLSSLEYHVSVELRAETAVKAVEIVDAESAIHSLENADSVTPDLNSLPHNEHIAFSRFYKGASALRFRFKTRAGCAFTYVNPVVLSEVFVISLLPVLVVFYFDLVHL